MAKPSVSSSPAIAAKRPQLFLRFLSALVLIPTTLYLIWYQPVIFNSFIWLWVAIGWFEWLNMMGRRQPVPTEVRLISFIALFGIAAFNAAAPLSYTIAVIGLGAVILAMMGMRYRLSPQWLAGRFYLFNLWGSCADFPI